MEFTVPDTLVLKIVEYDVDLKRNDNTLFILYDKAIHRYVIRGKRNDVNVSSCTYSYECKSASDLADFLGFLLDETNKLSYIVYNYDNLPETSNDITFEFLNKNYSKFNELFGYDNQLYNRKTITKVIRTLKNVFNYY